MSAPAFLLTALLVGCPHHAPRGLVARDPALAGHWLDVETGTDYEIRFGPDGPVCLAAINQGGEVLEVRSSSSGGGTFNWAIHVPSTGYDVLFTAVALDGDLLATTWSGTAGSGQEVLRRNPDPPVSLDATSLAGTWRDEETQTLFTIHSAGGTPTLVSAIDPDGEVITITATTWTEGRFGWTVHITSTGYDLSYDVLRVDGNTMKTRWHGTGGQGEETLTKVP